MRRVAIACLWFLLAAGCGGETSSARDGGVTDIAGEDRSPPPSDDGGADAPPDGPALEPVTIRFAARINGEPFACGRVVGGVGSTMADYTAADFRFYVHDVALVTDSGQEVPVALDQDGVWQKDNLVLLDFEDGSSACQSGTPETHTEIRGRVPPNSYRGIRFTVGIPFAVNHIDPTNAPPPLDVTSMFWAWRAGYRFLRIDGLTASPSGFSLHLGSTGCMGPSPAMAPTGECASPNRPRVELDGFDPATQVIVADVGRVLREVDVDFNSPNTGSGCQSDVDDPDCETIFPKLGLPFGMQPAGAQELFSVE